MRTVKSVGGQDLARKIVMKNEEMNCIALAKGFVVANWLIKHF